MNFERAGALPAGQDVPFADMKHVYNVWLQLHDILEAKLNQGLDSPERSCMLSEHTAMCDDMSRMITVIALAGHTISHSDAVYGFGGSERDRDHYHVDVNSL